MNVTPGVHMEPYTVVKILAQKPEEHVSVGIQTILTRGTGSIYLKSVLIYTATIAGTQDHRMMADHGVILPTNQRDGNIVTFHSVDFTLYML